MPEFRTRRFQPGDEAELNERYVTVTRQRFPGSSRSLESMRWLWYCSPGGPMESWVIEAENPDGSWRIIGHHGLCPVRFTLGERDLLCAKTTNTFLLPEFRSRFLYVRFERQCLAEVNSRYDAIYSLGPGVARLRKPIGYDLQDTWISLEFGSRYLDLATRLLAHFVYKSPGFPWSQIAGCWADSCLRVAPKAPFEWIEYTSEEAMGSPFFTDFWQQARVEAGMCPRRDSVDLAWRYWTHPVSRFVTLVHSWAGGARAYCVIETTNPFVYQLFDIFVTPMRADLLDAALSALFAWCARRRALTVCFNTTIHGQPAELMEVFTRRMHRHPLTRFRKQYQFCRYITPRGKAETDNLSSPWNITDLLHPY